ncbi:NTP transferase domain-containing protein, partial [Candidatus Saganbacteria bacterium]|nr:NTP transferase domain-containing protein [Candidatus Saganbacteria bacterium]
MKAVVLAGGFGTRLHPLTVNRPKPMVPVANCPLMEYVIYLLRKHKFKDIVVLLYHQPEIIKEYFGDGSKFGVSLSYIEAKEDYGTAGAVRFAAQNFKDTFLVISADLVTNFNLEEAVKFHKEKLAVATMVLTHVANPLPYGIVFLDKAGRIRRFLEKPSWGEVFSDTINCGIYLLEPSALNYVSPEQTFDFSRDLFPLLLSESLPLYGYVAEGLWKDIGNLTEYSKAHCGVFEGKAMQISKKAVISPSAQLTGGGIIGDKTVVGDEAVLNDVSIGKNCSIGRGAYLRQSVIWDNVSIGSEARLERVIIADGTVISDRCNLEEGVVIGEKCNVGRDANVKPYVKIWPSRVIEEGATVSRSMVWRERWSRGIFGPYGVTGLCNVEMTPEFAASLGAAYGSILGKGSYITTSRDSHKASRMIYRALVSGVLSSGVNVSNLEMIPVPVNRYEMKALKSRGGFHVRKSPYDPEVIDLKFFDENGMDISSSREKKIERLFFGEEFQRLGIEEVGELTFPFHRVAEYYKEGVLNCLDREALQRARLKVVVDYAYSSASQIFPSILGELGVEAIALNAHIDETKITKTRTVFERGLSQLSNIVKSLDADLGIMLDTGAEKIFLCDEKGKVLCGDLELAVMTILRTMLMKKAQIAVSVKASRVIDGIARKNGAKVIRTKTSSRDMMEVSA